MANGDRDFATGLRSGINDRKHFDAMGIALWTFVWLVDRQTDPNGTILGGRVLTYQEIADGVGLHTPTQARKHIRVLRAGGYIVVHRGRAGIRVSIAAPRKAFRAIAATTATHNPNVSIATPRKAHSEIAATTATLPKRVATTAARSATTAARSATTATLYKDETQKRLNKTQEASKHVSTQEEQGEASTANPSANEQARCARKAEEPVSREQAAAYMAEIQRVAKAAKLKAALEQPKPSRWRP